MIDAGDKQHQMREWIRQHVLYCASTLVYELTRGDGAGSGYYEDLMEVLVQDDWQSPAEEGGYSVAAVMCDRNNNWVPKAAGEQGFSWICYRTEEGLDAALQADDVDDRINQNSEQDTWRAACEDNHRDPYQHEAYEHWIVSQWFAERLKEKGEMVVGDFLGLTIWGRCCTGQAIILDGVVEEIYDEMMERRG